MDAVLEVPDPAGEWQGIVRALHYETPAKLLLSRTGDRFSGVLCLDNFEVTDAALSGIHFTERSFHFEVCSKVGILTFDGVFVDGKMMGHIQNAGCTTTFVFNRQ